MTVAAKTSHASLAEALVAAQAEFPAVEKDSTNPHFKSKFTSLDHLIAKTRPVLNRHGLSIAQWTGYDLTEPEGIVIHTLTTRIRHVTGQFEESTMALIVGKNDMQGLGGAITYAKRYAWGAALGISTDEDDDGNQASRPEVATRPRSRRAEAAPELADADGVAAYKVAVEDAGLDWAAAFAALERESNPVTAEALAKHRGMLADYLAGQAAKAEA